MNRAEGINKTHIKRENLRVWFLGLFAATREKDFFSWFFVCGVFGGFFWFWFDLVWFLMGAHLQSDEAKSAVVKIHGKGTSNIEGDR